LLSYSVCFACLARQWQAAMVGIMIDIVTISAMGTTTVTITTEGRGTQMGIDDVDKRFARKSAQIRLECENCGLAPDNVQARRPRWFNDHQDVCLCNACIVLELPTAPALVAQRYAALNAAGYMIMSSSMACLAGGLVLWQW
jgi:hypothetical protein